VLLDRDLETGVVGNEEAGRIGRSFDDVCRDWVAGNPYLDLPVIDRVAAAEHFGSGVAGILVRADPAQDGLGTCFVVAVQRRHDRRISSWFVPKEATAPRNCSEGT
jgi:hypothetical protein